MLDGQTAAPSRAVKRHNHPSTALSTKGRYWPSKRIGAPVIQAGRAARTFRRADRKEALPQGILHA
jgi:hypothetical protein